MRKLIILIGLPALSGWCSEHAEGASRLSPNRVDVIEYSGTPCGIAAAIMAAREGAEVLLIEPPDTSVN